MKANRCGVVIALALVGVLLACGTVWAGISWVTDGKTGVKIGINVPSDAVTVDGVSWSGPAVDGKAEGKGNIEFTVRSKDGKSYQGKGEAELRAGLFDGKATLKYSDGDEYDGYYKAGLREGVGTYKFTSGTIYEGDWLNGEMDGKGKMKYSDGRLYEGDFKKSVPHGFGIGKDAAGKIFHDGEWKDGEPLIPLKADKVLGIPWGATEEQVKSIMKQRPKTTYVPYLNGKDTYSKWQFYQGPYADFAEAWIYVHFYQEKMWMVQVSWPLKEDEVLERFNVVKQGLTTRYGVPSSDKGKYLDSITVWDLGGGYSVNVQIKKNTTKIAAADPQMQTTPFRVFITYNSRKVAGEIDKTANPSGISKDY